MITTLDKFFTETKTETNPKTEKTSFGGVEIPEILTLHEISRLVPQLNLEAQKFFYNSIIAENYNDLHTDDLNLSNHDLKKHIKEKLTPQRLKLAQDTTQDGLLWINAHYIIALEDFTEVIEVTNDFNNTIYGYITKNGDIINECEIQDDDFNINKLIIEKVNHDKEYEIGLNELKRLKAGESIVKGCLFLADNGGTALVKLRFTHLL